MTRAASDEPQGGQEWLFESARELNVVQAQYGEVVARQTHLLKKLLKDLKA